MNIKVYPGTARGRVRPPSSKSMAHRAVPVMEAVTAIGLFDLLLDKGRDLWKAGF